METKKDIRCSTEQYELVSSVVDPVLKALHGFIVGQVDSIDKTILALLAVGQCDINPITNNEPFFGCGHNLLIGPTGTGKTILCKMLAALVGGKQNRIQGSPDLLPSDITGFEMLSLRPGEDTLQFRKGPVFTNILLADEINRIPPKAAAGLLQAMAEGIVTHADETYILEEPFLCLGTMNPSEQSGTFELNEALSDRFMFCVLMEETTEEQRVQVAHRTEEMDKLNLKPVTDLETINHLRHFVFKNVYISDEVLMYCARVIQAVNHPKELDLFKKERGACGRGQLFRQTPPLNDRTTIFLRGAAKAQAALNYRDYVTIKDVRYILPSVLRSRLSLITEGALLSLVDEEGDALYLNKQSLVTSLTKQVLKGVPVV